MAACGGEGHACPLTPAAAKLYGAAAKNARSLKLAPRHLLGPSALGQYSLVGPCKWSVRWHGLALAYPLLAEKFSDSDRMICCGGRADRNTEIFVLRINRFGKASITGIGV